MHRMEQFYATGGVFFMRRWRPAGAVLGFLMIVLGVLIVFAMLLPAGFWWFLLGVALIACGFCCVNRR